MLTVEERVERPLTAILAPDGGELFLSGLRLAGGETS
jgi:hypothetical protein